MGIGYHWKTESKKKQVPCVMRGIITAWPALVLVWWQRNLGDETVYGARGRRKKEGEGPAA